MLSVEPPIKYKDFYTITPFFPGNNRHTVLLFPISVMHILKKTQRHGWYKINQRNKQAINWNKAICRHTKWQVNEYSEMYGFAFNTFLTVINGTNLSGHLQSLHLNRNTKVLLSWQTWCLLQYRRTLPFPLNRFIRKENPTWISWVNKLWAVLSVHLEVPVWSSLPPYTLSLSSVFLAFWMFDWA